MALTNRKRRLAAVSVIALSSSCDAFVSSTCGARTITRIRKTGTSLFIRNVDLPECVIFYGSDSMLSRGVDDGSSSSSYTVRPGVNRLLAECAEVGTPALLLSEHMRAEDLDDVLLSAEDDYSELSTFVPYAQNFREIGAEYISHASVENAPGAENGSSTLGQD